MLYQEIRPDCLDNVVGNRSTVDSLGKLIKKEPKDRPHSILLQGPKGCGKTTLGRIIAKEFGTRNENLEEINAADLRGIDGVRDINERIQFRPLGGGTVTFIMDECHRLTKDAQSALLKSTEDTPEYAYFIFCTTNPEQLLGTLRNRCSSYAVQQLRSKDIVTILKRACEIKKIKLEEDILEIIASNCDRTPRTSLVILEKIADLTDLDEIADVIAAEIDSYEKGEFFDLCKMLLVVPEKRSKNWQKIIKEYKRLEEHPEQVRNGILTFMMKQLDKIGPNEIEYARDISRTMRILSTNTYYGGKGLMTALLLDICLGEG